MFLSKNLVFLWIVILLSLLSACGGKRAVKPTVDDSAPASGATPKTNTGKYYLDDGPGENPPANIDLIPDATLKTEALLPRANKPYTALGQRYVPMTSYSPYQKQGIASWYGKRYHGRKTSSGEVYDMYGMSAAHPTLPLPSYARVTNPANGRSVIVRINDRGPFKHNRLIDLSYAAAYKLRLAGQGSGLVKVEAIDTSPQAMQGLPKNVAIPADANLAINTSDATTSSTLPPPLDITPTLETQQYYVQAGAFRSETNGNLLQKKIQSLELAENVGLANVYNNGLYRVRLGPYTSKAEANASAANIRKRLNTSAIVQLQ
ncbi:MAG: septal ring lytic transglycosylase RlpA family lipoprotein [Methylotenera sp.]|nr:MAG: septal ring lytic transglycosylase RlpA family lipoprotein [Methylotenera sp.]